MQNQDNDKIIQKLLKKAEIIDKVEIKPERITEMGLETFYETYKRDKSKLYYKDNKIYLKHSGGWYVTKLGIDLKELEEKTKKIENLTKRIQQLENWTRDIKSYIDIKFEEVNKEIKKPKKKK